MQKTKSTKLLRKKSVKKPGTGGHIDLDWGLICALGALGAVRPLIHDLPTFADAQLLQGVVAVSIFGIILAAPILFKVKRPLATLVLAGGVYGVLSIVVHQLLWTTVFPEGYPLTPDAAYQPPEVLVRILASIATLVTSLLTGFVLGCLATLISKFTYNK